MSKITVQLIAAARPNFMKVAPVYRALARDLGLPVPRFHIEVGCDAHAERAGGVMIAYEKVAMREKPDWIVVVGDVEGRPVP